MVHLHPEQFLILSDEDCRAVGLSGAKTNALRHIATAIVSGHLDPHGLCQAPAEHAIKELTAIKGVGPWTAEVYLLACAGHPDVFPAGDIALQNAAARFLKLEQRPSTKEMRELAHQWAPWRAVAARVLWSYYAATTGRSGLPTNLSEAP